MVSGRPPVDPTVAGIEVGASLVGPADCIDAAAELDGSTMVFGKPLVEPTAAGDGLGELESACIEMSDAGIGITRAVDTTTSVDVGL